MEGALNRGSKEEEKQWKKGGKSRGWGFHIERKCQRILLRIKRNESSLCMRGFASGYVHDDWPERQRGAMTHFLPPLLSSIFNFLLFLNHLTIHSKWNNTCSLQLAHQVCDLKLTWYYTFLLPDSKNTMLMSWWLHPSFIHNAEPEEKSRSVNSCIYGQMCTTAQV